MVVDDLGRAGIELARGMCPHHLEGEVRNPARSVVVRGLRIVVLRRSIGASCDALVLVADTVCICIVDARSVAVQYPVRVNARVVRRGGRGVVVAGRSIHATGVSTGGICCARRGHGVATDSGCVEALGLGADARSQRDHEGVALAVPEDDEVASAGKSAGEAARGVFVPDPVATRLDKHFSEGQILQHHRVVKLETRQPTIRAA